VIRWDGQLMACCVDVDGEIEVGNLKDTPFQQLWEGPRMTRYRIWHILGEFEKIPRCLACGGINFYKLEPDEVREYLEEIGRPELFARYLERLELNEV
jgi:hypothetical protein